MVVKQLCIGGRSSTTLQGAPCSFTSVMAPAHKLRKTATAAVAAPEPALAGLQIFDASRLSEAVLRKATARPRIDFASVLDTVSIGNVYLMLTKGSFQS